MLKAEGGAIRYQSPFCHKEDAIVLVRPPGMRASQMVVVEGPLDALAVAECGYLGCGLMGVNPPDDVLAHVAVINDTVQQTLILCDRGELSQAAMMAACIGSQSKRGTAPTIGDLPFEDVTDLAEVPVGHRQNFLDEFFEEV